MISKKNSSIAPGAICIGALALFQSGSALAVNGISLSGVGVKSSGMGGASIALPQDSAVASSNPAGMALIGNRWDAGLQVLRPPIDYQYGDTGDTLRSRDVAPVPEGGFNMQLSPDLTAGVSIFGVGVGVDYGRPLAPVAGAEKAKSSLQVAITAPTLTYKIADGHYAGVSLELAYERFFAKGLLVPNGQGGLAPLPSHDTASALGYGARFGYMWQPMPGFSVGVSYATRINMARLAGYDRDLLAAGGGRIDVPAQYGAGLAYKPISTLTIAVDWLHIQHTDTIIGSSQGFGWNDQNIARIGVAYDLAKQWTVRAGYNHGNSSFGSTVVAQNVLSALGNAKAASAGFTYRLAGGSELSVNYEYGSTEKTVGSGASAGFNVSASTQVIGLSYGNVF
jgi:long-chain fatty acid transport protein